MMVAVVSIILYQTFTFLGWSDPVQITLNSWSKQVEIDKTTRVPTIPVMATIPCPRTVGVTRTWSGCHPLYIECCRQMFSQWSFRA